jgi:hypothetical protein
MLHVGYELVVDVQAIGAALRGVDAALAVLPPGHALALDDVPRVRRLAVVHVDLRGCWDR